MEARPGMSLPQHISESNRFHAAVRLSYELRHREKLGMMARNGRSEAARLAGLQRQTAMRVEPLVADLQRIVDLLETDDDLRAYLARLQESESGITQTDVDMLRCEGGTLTTEILEEADRQIFAADGMRHFPKENP